MAAKGELRAKEDRRIRGATVDIPFLMLILLLLVCTGYLVDGSFSPFLYFRF